MFRGMSRIIVLLVTLLGSVSLFAVDVRGRVADAVTGELIIGANVVVDGSTKGTISDLDGSFLLTDVDDNAQIVISYLGYQTLTMAVSSEMTIALHEDTESLDEVIVVAYGEARKSSYAGSASLVGQKDITNHTGSSFEGALNGKVAGLQVTQSSGQAGSAPSLRIRGIGSMNAGNEPLYIVDGVPMNSGDIGQMSTYTLSTNNAMNAINPEDIESISVLKDAAASSLYGSRAANGVVIIMTKHGKEGKPQVGLRASVGFTPCWATDNYEAMPVEQQVDMLYSVFFDYETVANHKMPTDAAIAAINRLQTKFNMHGYDFSVDYPEKYAHVTISDYDNSGRAGKYFDWDKAYFRTAISQTYDVSVSGGTQNTTYYTSIGYTKDEGRVRVNDFSRITGKVSLTNKAGKLFQFDTNINFAHTKRSGYNDSRSLGSNLFFQSRNMLWGLYWPTDYKTGKDWTNSYGSLAYNNLYYQNEWENSSKANRLQASERVTVHIIPGLDLSSVLSYDNNSVRDHVYYSAEHFNGIADGGVVHEMRTVYEKLLSSTTLSYKALWKEVHSLNMLAGFEAEKTTTDFTRSTGKGLPNSGLHTVATAGTTEATGSQQGYAMLSILTKVDYNYNERYFGSVSYRADASSRLSPETRWGHFWSVAGAWKMINEDWMSPARSAAKLSELKLRVSYGVNGTLPTACYGYMSLMDYTYKYMGEAGGTIVSPENGDLTWETSYNANAGVDFGFFHQRLRGTVEYFNRLSTNLLQDVPVSMTTGFSTALQNVGEITNQGVEFELSGDIIAAGDWRWSAGINGAFVANRIDKLYDGQDIIWYDPTGNDKRAQYVYRVGAPVLSFYGYEWAGVNPENGKSVYYTNDHTDGDFLFNGRGATYSYLNAQKVIIGNATPKLAGGINTSVSWRGLELGLNFLYKIGGELYDGAERDVADDGYYWERIRSVSYYENMWMPNRTDGAQPCISGMDLDDAIQYSSRHIYNASFLRLKNLTLSYSLPKTLIQKAYMSAARIYFNATNLLTVAAYKEADPEVNAYGTRGWETPIGKTFVLGFEIKF